MSKEMRIDFVSDVSCPWCIIGLKALEQALANVGEAVDATSTSSPSNSIPAMAPEGEDIGEHLMKKYGASAAQRAQTSEMIRARGEELGFEFRQPRPHLQHLRRPPPAALGGRAGLAARLENGAVQRLFHGGRKRRRPRRAGAPGRPGRAWTRRKPSASSSPMPMPRKCASASNSSSVTGINSVPAIIINQKHLISGGQPPEVFEQAIRDIAAKE